MLLIKKLQDLSLSHFNSDDLKDAQSQMLTLCEKVNAVEWKGRVNREQIMGKKEEWSRKKCSSEGKQDPEKRSCQHC